MRSGGDQFDRTFELIYDVAVMPSLWPELLGYGASMPFSAAW